MMSFPQTYNDYLYQYHKQGFSTMTHVRCFRVAILFLETAFSLVYKHQFFFPLKSFSASTYETMNRQFISLILILFIEMTRATSYKCDKSSVCGCSTTASTTLIESRIIGGEKVKNRAWGWIVSLQMNRRHQCAATLLTDQFAITAAHCFSNQVNPSNYSILAGTNNLNDETNSIAQRRTIQEIYRHRQFNAKIYSHDIAIIRFAPLSTSSNSTLSFICLPRLGEDPFEINSNLVTIGWGIKTFADLSYSNSLQQVTVQVIASNSNQCQRTQLTDQTQHFCAGVSNGGKGN